MSKAIKQFDKMIHEANQSAKEIVAYLSDADLDPIDMTSEEVLDMLASLSQPPLRPTQLQGAIDHMRSIKGRIDAGSPEINDHWFWAVYLDTSAKRRNHVAAMMSSMGVA